MIEIAIWIGRLSSVLAALVMAGGGGYVAFRDDTKTLWGLLLIGGAVCLLPSFLYFAFRELLWYPGVTIVSIASVAIGLLDVLSALLVVGAFVGLARND